MENQEYDISLKQVPKTISGKKYVLQEATGDTAAKYRNMTVNGLALNDGKVVGVSGVGDLQPFLVSECLYEVKDMDGGMAVLGRRADLKTVRSWPERIVRDLFNEAKRISLLDEPLTVEDAVKQRDQAQAQLDRLLRDDAKNLPSGSTTGSEQGEPTGKTLSS